MTAPVPATAGSVTVRQTLALLDDQFRPFTDAVAEGRYTFWIGSGISRSCVDGLHEVLDRALTFLQSRIDQSDPDCAHLDALRRVVALAQLSADDQAKVDLSMPPSTWPVLPEILATLTNKYSQVLDVRVNGKSEDYMVWDAVDVVGTFAGPTLQAGCEHLCIAILAIEGVLPSMVTANWDGLIEAAVGELTDHRYNPMQICVTSADFSTSPQRSRLLKFHGCAIRARDSEVEYRRYLVGSQSQITRWPHDHAHAVMRHEMESLAAVRATLMLGLSGQDSDIQDTFAKAVALSPRAWPEIPPAFVFAEDELGPMQLNILRVGYGDTYGSHATTIDTGAVIRAYASPLLISLVLSVLMSKLLTFARAAFPLDFPEVDGQQLARGLRELRNLISAAADADRTAFVRNLVKEMTRSLTLFQEGIVARDETIYRPLSFTPVHQIAQDPGSRLNGLSQMATALAVIGLGHSDGTWTVATDTSADLERSAINARAAGGDARIYFAADANAAMRLMIGDSVDVSDRDVIVIHSKAPPPPLPRAPRAPFGRTGTGRLREVDMSNLILTSADIPDLRRQFRAAAVM